MKAVRLNAGSMTVDEVPIPKPASGQVLIKQVFSGVCYRDLLTRRGFFRTPKKSITLGHEGAGRVTEVGRGVQDFQIGDKVASLTSVPCGHCVECNNGNENLCHKKLVYGEKLDGSYSEYMLAHVNGLVKIPDGVNWEAATIGACIFGMLLRALTDRANARAGETAIITGAGGGVGIHAVQMVKALGCRVIATTSSEWKADKIRRTGADEVVASSGNFSDRIRELTAGRGGDLLVEIVGGSNLEESIKSVRWGGRILLLGNVDPQPTSVQWGRIILRENAVIGSIGSTKRSLRDAFELVRLGKVRPILDRILPLDRASEGHKILEAKQNVGKILLEP